MNFEWGMISFKCHQGLGSNSEMKGQEKIDCRLQLLTFLYHFQKIEFSMSIYVHVSALQVHLEEKFLVDKTTLEGEFF